MTMKYPAVFRTWSGKYQETWFLVEHEEEFNQKMPKRKYYDVEFIGLVKSKGELVEDSTDASCDD